MSGQGSGKTPLSEAQDCRFFILIKFRPADALLSPEQGGNQGTLFVRNVVQDYVRACVSAFIFFVCCICSAFFFGLTLSPLAGLYVGDATFHPGYLSFPRLIPHHADGPRTVFGMTSPLY